jgi:signal transduction histidine kinase
MSLHRRLAVVLVLGLSALAIAVAAIVQLLATTDAARERTAEADAEAGAQALADGVDGSMLDVGEGRRRTLQKMAASVLRPVPNASGGYCSRSGEVFVTAGRGGRADGPRGKLTPEEQDAVAGLCARAPAKGRIDEPHGVDRIATVSIGDRGAAWFLARAHAHASEAAPAWLYEVVLLALAAVALAGFTIDAMIALRRGADELTTALSRLAEDLRAPVPRPRARELGDIAQGLGTMAVRLADARDRERDMSQKLSREQRLAALGRVVAGVAHEVRNPLAGMKLRLDLLARARGLDAAAQEDVTVCLGEIQRLNRLVESLLTVSRAKTRVTMPVELGKLADDRIARAAPFAERGGVRLARVGDATASADPDALAGAVDNLLRNAVEASPPGELVAVRVAMVDGAVVLDVEDGGPGIPEARRAELFEPFFTTKPEGTGLGLWISRLLLEAKGASLGYDRAGGRTRMRITFPR